MTRTVRYANRLGSGQYTLVARAGRDYAEGFTPELTPAEMLRRGVFGGRYLNSCRDEYPAAWFRGVRLADRHDASLNAYGASSGQSLAEWQQRGWIAAQDPRGWFEWYCRYTLGRRIPEYDDWQISRWCSFGARHKGQLKSCIARNPTLPYLKQRQGLLQWAYDPQLV